MDTELDTSIAQYCDATRGIAAATGEAEALAAGLRALVDGLGPESAAVAVLHSGAVGRCPGGDEPRATARLAAGPAAALCRAALAGGGGHLWPTAPELEAALGQVDGGASAALLSGLGRWGPSAVLALPLTAGQTEIGCVLLGADAARLREPGSLALAGATSACLALALDRLALRRAGEEAERGGTSPVQAEVIAVLSHQMRTPLAAIKGYATALLLQGDAYDDALRRECLSAIDEEADSLTGLIGDLLDSSAIEAGLLRIELQPVLLPRLAVEAIRHAAHRGESHRFVVSFPPGFPVVHADPTHIQQVFHNLLDNAVKYSAGGLITVRGLATATEVVVSVADQGIGIAPEHLNRLFERFYRIKDSQRRSVTGTGLGLPIARAIVEAHGGRIWAESAPGRGSTFCFTLPRAAAGPGG